MHVSYAFVCCECSRVAVTVCCASPGLETDKPQYAAWCVHTSDACMHVCSIACMHGCMHVMYGLHVVYVHNGFMHEYVQCM